MKKIYIAIDALKFKNDFSNAYTENLIDIEAFLSFLIHRTIREDFKKTQ